MPGYLGEPRSFGLKVVSVMPGNHGTRSTRIRGSSCSLASRMASHGDPRRDLDHRHSPAAARRWRRIFSRAPTRGPGPDRVGRQARAHLVAMSAVRALRRVRVWSRTRANAERFAREELGARGSHRSRRDRRGSGARRRHRLHDHRVARASLARCVARGRRAREAVGACFAPAGNSTPRSCAAPGSIPIAGVCLNERGFLLAGRKAP